MAREKIWKAYILDDQGTEFTDDPYNSIRNAVIDGDLKWPLNVPATSHPEKSDASDVFLKKDIDGNYIPREITEAEFENYFNLEDDETGSLDVNGNLMSEEDQTEMRSILREIIIDVYFEEGIHYQWERFEWEDVVSWKIKGLWYFDNIQSELKYRIIGIAPVTIPVGLIQQDESTQDITINDDSDESSDEPLCEDEFGNEVTDWYWIDPDGNRVADTDLEFRETVFTDLMNRYNQEAWDLLDAFGEIAPIVGFDFYHYKNNFWLHALSLIHISEPTRRYAI